MSDHESTLPVGDVDEVFQEDGAPTIGLVVPVSVDGPVQTHDLPSVSGGMRSRPVLLTDQALKIAGADRRRRIARVWADQPFWIGVDQNSVVNTGTVAYAAKASANMIITITHAEEIWVKASADMTLSYVIENWAS